MNAPKKIFQWPISKFSPPPVADLGEGAEGDRPPLREKFFDFSQQKRAKMNLHYLEWTLKSGFCRRQPLPSKKVPSPSKILDPPLATT
jgi:hypothetical protein